MDNSTGSYPGNSSLIRATSENNSEALLTAIDTLYAMVGFLTFVLNFGVLLVVFIDKLLRKDSHCAVVLSLSISDLTVGFCVMVRTLISRIDSLKTSSMCLIGWSLYFTSVSVSNLQIIFICTSRIIAIKFPHKFKNIFTIKIIIFSIVVMWVTTLIEYGIPISFWVRDPFKVRRGCSPFTFVTDALELYRLYALDSLFRSLIIIIVFTFLLRQLYLKRRNKIGPNICSEDRIRESSSDKRQQNTVGTSCNSYDKERNATINADSNQEGLKPTCNKSEDSGFIGISSNSVPSSSTQPGDNAGTSSQIRRPTPATTNQQRRSSEDEAIRSLTFVVVTCSLVSIPPMLFLLMSTYTVTMEYGNLFRGMRGLLLALTNVNSVINPIAYAFTMKKFRDAIRRRFRNGRNN